MDFTRDIIPDSCVDEAIDDYKEPEENVLVNGELVRGKLLKKLSPSLVKCSFNVIFYPAGCGEYFIIFVSPEMFFKSSTDSKYADYYIHGHISLR